jgi:ubiquinol-cytochrome c reductase cytochrome c subunit
VTDDIEPTDLDPTADELSFEPAVPATGAAPRPSRPSRPSRFARADKRGPRESKRPGLRRRIGASIVLLGALGTMGSAYAAFAASSGAAGTGMSAQDIAAGHQLYQVSCITCHGANLEGIKGQGPSLVGVGQAAVYFQVITGRMPAAGQGAYEPRKEAKFNEQQTEQLAAYVESLGGGPSVPNGNLRGTDAQIADGGALFRLNCASCHGTTFKGAPLSAGKVAPSLNESTDKVMYAAMLSGPENMPVFSDNELTPTEKKSIIAYVQTLKASRDPGGAGVDRIGPVSEALVIWVAGVGVIMVAILWIGARAR